MCLKQTAVWVKEQRLHSNQYDQFINNYKWRLPVKMFHSIVHMKSISLFEAHWRSKVTQMLLFLNNWTTLCAVCCFALTFICRMKLKSWKMISRHIFAAVDSDGNGGSLDSSDFNTQLLHSDSTNSSSFAQCQIFLDCCLWSNRSLSTVSITEQTHLKWWISVFCFCNYWMFLGLFF